MIEAIDAYLGARFDDGLDEPLEEVRGELGAIFPSLRTERLQRR